MGRALKIRARALKVEHEPGPSLGPSKKVEPEPRRASNFYSMKAPIFWALLKESSPSLGPSQNVEPEPSKKSRAEHEPSLGSDPSLKKTY